jgi:phosphatidylglycerophosphatase A
MSPFHRRSLRVLATWFGCGLAPWLPGTAGTLGAIPLVWFFLRMGQMQYLYASFAFAVFAILVSQLYEIEVAGAHDTPELVIDEVAGFLVTMAWLPFDWRWVGLGFVLFRFFDMLKPFPISWVDRRIEGGVGAVADDLLAGIVSNIILQYLFQNHLLMGMS